MTQRADSVYLNLLRQVLDYGQERGDRTGTGTISRFGLQARYPLILDFPLLTTKKIFWKGVVEELLWFIRGETNVKSLQEKGVHIWDEWADENGDLGPVYGSQWRNWQAVNDYYNRSGDRLFGSRKGIDQLQNAIQALRINPESRRIIVSAWNPADVDDMALPPCHTMFQFYSRQATEDDLISFAISQDLELDRKITDIFNSAESQDDAAAEIARFVEPIKESLIANHKGKRILDCQLYQRSADMFLGVPFNIASYSLLTAMVAKVTNHIPGEFVHSIGDAHIYLNHREQVEEQLQRMPLRQPTLQIVGNATEIDQIRAEDIVLTGYEYHPAIKAPIAV